MAIRLLGKGERSRWNALSDCFLLCLALALLGACGGDGGVADGGLGPDGATMDASRLDAAALDGSSAADAQASDSSTFLPPECRGDQQSCALSEHCCEGLVCQGGQCRLPPAICGANADSCAFAGDCCPGLICNAGTCGYCAEQGLTCEGDGECCSGYCRNGHCAVRPDPASCYPLVEDCSGDLSRCCEEADSCRASDNALANSLCCKEALQPCGGSWDCCGEMSCRAGVCQYAEDRCADHPDCAPGLSCLDGRCGFGECNPLRAPCGDGCCPGLQCWIDGLCVLRIGSGLCTPDGQSCTGSDECCGFSICNSAGICNDVLSCGLTGERCDRHSECCTESCLGGQCARTTGGIGGGGGSCSDSGQLCGGAFGGSCCAGLSCEGGRCASSVCGRDGTVCADASQCCSGRCTDRLCGIGAGCGLDGSACEGGSQCCSGRCVDRQCIANVVATCAEENGSCGPSAACCPGLSCEAGRCNAPAGSCAGDDCRGGVDCCGAAPHCWSASAGIAVYRCRAECGYGGAACLDDGACCPGLQCRGETCVNPTPCEGRSCGFESCCDLHPYCVDGGCAGSCGSRGVSCSDDADCCSWTCDFDTERCH